MIEHDTVLTSAVELWPHNPRVGDVDAIAESLQVNGQYRPIVVNRPTMQVLAGNHTLAAARQLGWETIDVTWVDVDEDAATRIVLADNRTAERATYNDPALLELLVAMSKTDAGMAGTGWRLQELDDLQRAMDATDPWSERPLQPTPDSGDVEEGQVWQVGRHRLACGDCRDPDVWATLLAGRQVDMVFTDPPYGIAYTGGGVAREPLEGDTSDAAVPLLEQALEAVGTVVAPGVASYICLPPDEMFPPFATMLAARGLYRWMLVWVKDRATFGRADYHQQHEPIVYGWWPGAAHHKVEDRTQTTVWNIPRPADSDRHPTAKPPELAQRAIVNSTHPDQTVADPFAGSASTLVAAHRTGRIGVGIELEPGYVATALDWLKEETGETPQLVHPAHTEAM